MRRIATARGVGASAEGGERERVLLLIKMIERAIREIDLCDIGMASRLYIDTVRRVAQFSRVRANPV